MQYRSIYLTDSDVTCLRAFFLHPSSIGEMLGLLMVLAALATSPKSSSWLSHIPQRMRQRYGPACRRNWKLPLVASQSYRPGHP